jgi:hypothetical protein
VFINVRDVAIYDFHVFEGDSYVKTSSPREWYINIKLDLRRMDLEEWI